MSNRFRIHRLTPRNFLSFGPEFEGIELGPLNVLIGANGCGKSNLIEAVSFMRAAPRDISEVTRRGGGVSEWIWKGDPAALASVTLMAGGFRDDSPFDHLISFRSKSQSFAMEGELIQVEPTPYSTPDLAVPRSMLVDFRDPRNYPEIAWLADNYERIRIYRDWSFGRKAAVREPQKADERNDKLSENLLNLGTFLSRLRTQFPATKRDILNKLKDLYDGISDWDISTAGGTVLVYLVEGDFSIPATRLSDGTLRYLCLLAILCDPEPPPLICIEEPELGLHPDIIPKVADMLREASTRTQLIVTTHSDILIDALTDTPESVIVCSKEDGQTKMERLDAKEMAVWLEKYRLGELWSSGQIGGNRW